MMTVPLVNNLLPILHHVTSVKVMRLFPPCCNPSDLFQIAPHPVQLHRILPVHFSGFFLHQGPVMFVIPHSHRQIHFQWTAMLPKTLWQIAIVHPFAMVPVTCLTREHSVHRVSIHYHSTAFTVRILSLNIKVFHPVQCLLAALPRI